MEQKPKVLDLTLQKKFAIAMLRGEKTTEYRLYSKYFLNRLFERLPDGRMKRRQYDYIHFRDLYCNWFLDIEYKGLLLEGKRDVEYYKDRYDSLFVVGDEPFDVVDGEPILTDKQKKDVVKVKPSEIQIKLGKVLNTSIEEWE